MQAESGLVPPCPYLADVGVIALVPDRWGTAWMSRQQILTRLAMYFNVVWLNRGYSWRQVLQGGTPRRRVDYGAGITSGITIYNPERWLLELGRPRFLARWTMRERLRRVQQILRTRGCRKTILYLWRPHHELALDAIDYDLSCYHIADEYTFSPIEKPIGELEARLISRADQVFIHSPAMLGKKGKLNPQTAFVPNGVNYRAYATPLGEPIDLKPIPHPRVGYVGIIKTQLDLTLLSALAQRHPEWSFVLVGPRGNLGGQSELIHKLSSMPNVHLLGGKPVSALPAYTQHLDVCLLCYKVNDYTKFIYPLKLHEYLASGRPVAGSPIRSLQEFAHIIRLARTTDEWSQALTDLLAPAACSAEQVEARRAVARQYDWDRLVGIIARILCDRLGPSYLHRFEKISPSEHALCC
jgi:glycosyltransferase involved in cell wall biosynthesis